MTPHPRYKVLMARLCKLLADGLAVPWRSVVVRYVPISYSSAEAMMSGVGAFRGGGRWNAPGAFHAVYCSSNVELANREYFASCRAAGIPDHERLPLVGKAVRIDLAAALDLRDADVLRRLGVTQAQLRADKWRDETDDGRESLCQAIGRAASDAGVEALLVPSAHAVDASEYNIVLIIENALPSSGKWQVLRRHRK